MSSALARPLACRSSASFQNLLGDADIVVEHADLHLHAAQLDVVARGFRHHRQQRVAALVLSGLHLRVGGLHGAAHPPPDVQLPGGVEPDVIVGDRRHVDAAGNEAVHQAEDAILRILLADRLCAAIERGHLRGRRDTALEPAFGDAQARRLNVEILVGDLADQRGQGRIAETRPPRRIGRGRARPRDKGPVGQSGFGRRKIGADRVAAGQGEEKDDRLAHQCAPPGPPTLFLDVIRKVSGTTAKATMAQ